VPSLQMRGIVDLISQDTNLGERHFFVKNCPNHCKEETN